MGEAMSEGGVFAHAARSRALLEVVRLAFEGDLGFGSDLADASCVSTAGDAEPTACPTRHNARPGREYAPQPAHLPHRPASTGSSSRLVPGGPCTWCGVTSTPQWRRPRGTNKLLCNACGIFFTRYGRLPEKSHHAHGAPSSAPAAASPLSAGPASAGAAAPAPPQEGIQRDARAADGDGAVLEAPLDAPALLHSSQGPDEQQSPRPQPPRPHQPQHPHQPQQPQQPQPSASTSSLVGISLPLKRKDAPQPEMELLRCTEDCSGSTFMDTAASPAPPPSVPAAAPLRLHTGKLFSQLAYCPTLKTQQEQQQQQQQLGAAAAAAAAGDRTPAAGGFLAVTPLDLGLQPHIDHMQQLGLLGPAALAGLGVGLLPLPASLCLQGPNAITTTAASACNAAVTALALGYPAAAAVSGLPPALIGQPFSLPIGLLQQPGAGALLPDSAAAAAAAAAAAVPPPRPLYARPPKRQERLPAGESDDSNVSTDSHAAAHGDAGTSHDEDDCVGAAGRSSRAAGGTASGASGAAVAISIAGVGGGPPGSLSSSPPVMPAAAFPVAVLARPAAAVPLLPCASSAGGGGGSAGPSLPPLASANGAVPAAAEPPEGAPMELQLPEAQEQQQQQQQQAILLPTRRSKGPRSRATSGSANATPSSSAQS